MFCAYEGPARILRIYGRGTVHEFGTPEYDALIPAVQRRPGSRAAIVIDVRKVSTVRVLLPHAYAYTTLNCLP